MIEIEAKQKLLHVAEIIAHAKIHPAPLPKDQAEEFKVVVDKGVVEIRDDQIAFATPELLATWVPCYCAMRISDVWEDLDQTARGLLQAYSLFRTLRLLESATTQLFFSLENDCGKNVLARLEEAARLEVRANEPNIALNSIYFEFCKVLPELGYTPSDLANHLGPVLDATENYFFRGKLQGAVEQLAGQSQEKAEALLDIFLQRPEQRTVEFAANSLKSLWKFDPGKAYGKAMELTEAKLTPLKQVGIIAIACFNYERPSYEEELSATIDRLEELSENHDTNLWPTIAKAFGDLMANLCEGSQLQRIQKGLLRLASRKEPHVQFVVSRVLQQQAEDSGDTDWFWNTLGHLSDIPTHHQGILQILDWTTYGMVKHYPKRVIKYLEDVVTSRSYGKEGENDRLPKLYDNTVSHLIEKRQLVLESTITRWFASKDPRLHAAAADLVGRFVQGEHHQPGRTIRLDSSELNLFNEGDVQRVICALTGYVEDYKALASLLISVLSREIVSERVRELIANALEQVVLYNVPDLGDEYLRGLTQDTDIPEHASQVVTDALERSDAYCNSLKGRPYLKELVPTDIRVHRYRVKFQKQISLYREKALNESEFLGQIPKIPVKYGRSLFLSDDGDPASSVPMRTFCNDIKIPRELVIDPLGCRIKRIRWQRMAVVGIPVESQSPPADHCDEASDEKETEKS